MTPRQRQRGAVVLELAVMLPVLITILICLVYYGSILYSYEAAQRAARDAVRYLSTASPVNMKSTTLVANEIAVAQAIAEEELRVLQPAPGDLYVFAQCNGWPCTGASLPTTVQVSVQIQTRNTLPGDVFDLPTPLLVASHTMRYAGN